MKQYAALALLTLVACGHRADEDDVIPSKSCTVSPAGLVSCPDGSSFQIPKPEQGVKGDKGDVGPAGVGFSASTITMTASRTYNPSNWTNATETVAPNSLIIIPSELPKTSGNTGTGWAYISVNNVKYCFQGSGVNNSDAGTKWLLKHSRVTGNCDQPGNYNVLAAPQIATAGNNTAIITLSVSGGGLSSGLQVTTSINVKLQVLGGK